MNSMVLKPLLEASASQMDIQRLEIGKIGQNVEISAKSG